MAAWKATPCGSYRAFQACIVKKKFDAASKAFFIMEGLKFSFFFFSVITGNARTSKYVIIHTCCTGNTNDENVDLK